jgi:hypothetical protein
VGTLANRGAPAGGGARATETGHHPADLHLEIPEKVLNELLAELLATQKTNYPLLGMVKVARVNGPIVLEIQVGV